jgi:hypothetical protein
VRNSIPSLTNAFSKFLKLNPSTAFFLQKPLRFFNESLSFFSIPKFFAAKTSMEVGSGWAFLQMPLSSRRNIFVVTGPIPLNSCSLSSRSLEFSLFSSSFLTCRPYSSRSFFSYAVNICSCYSIVASVSALTMNFYDTFFVNSRNFFWRC